MPKTAKRMVKKDMKKVVVAASIVTAAASFLPMPLQFL
jgi:hypothetical protein